MAVSLGAMPAADAPKAVWREWALGVRPALAGDSGAVTAHLRDFLQARGIRRVLAYHALPGEPDISGLEADVELLTTRTHYKPERHLTIHPWHTATEPTRAGYLQPPRDAPQLALDRVEAVLLPGLAYDLRGVRLGYGGGFYDRLLPGYAGPTLGVGWAGLLLEQLPAEAHDIRVGWVATEEGVQAVRPG